MNDAETPAAQKSAARPARPPEFYVKEKPEARGMINPRKVKMLSFAIISICIVACALICILAVWDFANNDSVWRAFSTFLIVASATWIFAVINERFGD